MNLRTKIQLKEFKVELMRSIHLPTHLDVLPQYIYIYINDVSTDINKIKNLYFRAAKNNLEFCFYTNYV